MDIKFKPRMKFNHNIYIHTSLHNLYLNKMVFFFGQLGGGGNLELKSSEMARNRNKTAKSEVNF